MKYFRGILPTYVFSVAIHGVSSTGRVLVGTNIRQDQVASNQLLYFKMKVILVRLYYLNYFNWVSLVRIEKLYEFDQVGYNS